jgi:hypothetical protein
MLMFDLSTGKMTKMAFDFIDFVDIVVPILKGGIYGFIGLTLGDIIDQHIGIKDRWSTILGLTGLIAGLSIGGYSRYLARQHLEQRRSDETDSA